MMLGGRALKIVLAVDKKQAAKLKEKPEKNQDPRNLYLVREGLILPGTPAAAGVSEGDLAKRSKAYKAKKTNLKNSNYFVSKVRLSVRNLPLTFTDADLKQLFVKAVKDAQEEHPPTDKTLLQPSVKQAKIVRDSKRVGAEGIARSKRYGFVEFGRHEWALTALRSLNNNPHVFSKQSRPIIEFALDDHRKLLVRKKKHARALATVAEREKKRALQREEEAKLKKEAAASTGPKNTYLALATTPAPTQETKASKKRKKGQDKQNDQNSATKPSDNNNDNKNKKPQNKKQKPSPASATPSSSAPAPSRVPTLAEALAAKMGVKPQKPKQAPNATLPTNNNNTSNDNNNNNTAGNNKKQKRPALETQNKQQPQKQQKQQKQQPQQKPEQQEPQPRETEIEQPEKKRNRKANRLTRREQQEELEDQQFSSMVAKYKARFFDAEQDLGEEKKTRWYE